MTQGGAIRIDLGERRVAGKRLGRHIDHDPRSWSFPAASANQVESVKHEAVGLPLNQEAHRCSTAHALCAALDSGPNIGAGKVATESLAIQVYERAGEMDSVRRAGSEAGSSGLMACKAARELGLIRSYTHAFGLEHALGALTLRPVMTGVNWYSSFDEPDQATGLVEIGADAFLRGGHEVLADEIDLERELVWFWNSWGTHYGIGGRFCMSFDTWGRLLGEHGDVTVPLT